MRKTCIRMIGELARRDPRVVFIGSDLSPGLLGDMRAEFPDRHYMEGVSEQHLVGMAAGLAMNGYLPYVNTIATFLTRRAFEQVALDACLHRLPIRLIANSGGLVNAALGPTHLATEDIAIMRALPHMTVVCACDAEEMQRVMLASLEWPDPMYIRLARGSDPVVSDPARGFAIGRGILMRDTPEARPVLCVSTGIMTQRALAVADILAQERIPVRVLHFHTVKPLDAELLLRHAADARAIVTLEEHLRDGGLGSAVLETLADADAFAAPVRRLGLPDEFPDHYGRQEDLLATAGLDVETIAESVRELLARRAAAV